MLHFDGEPVRGPQLIALDGGRSRGAGRLSMSSLRHALPALLVGATTVFAVVVDVVDDTRLWSPVAVAVSAAVLSLHRLLVRFRAD